MFLLDVDSTTVDMPNAKKPAIYIAAITHNQYLIWFEINFMSEIDAFNQCHVVDIDHRYC